MTVLGAEVPVFFLAAGAADVAGGDDSLGADAADEDDSTEVEEEALAAVLFADFAVTALAGAVARNFSMIPMTVVLEAGFSFPVCFAITSHPIMFISSGTTDCALFLASTLRSSGQEYNGRTMVDISGRAYVTSGIFFSNQPRT